MTKQELGIIAEGSGYPEWMIGLSVIDIELETKLEDIPESNCEYCGEPAEKAYVEYTFAGGGETKILVRAKETAGYRCTGEHEELEFMSILAGKEALEKGISVLEEKGETKSIKYLQNAIEIHFS